MMSWKLKYAQIAAIILGNSRFKDDIEKIVVDRPYEIFMLFSFMFSVFSDELCFLLEDYYQKTEVFTNLISCADISKVCWSDEDELLLKTQELQQLQYTFIHVNYTDQLHTDMMTTNVLRSFCSFQHGLIYNRLPRSLIISLINHETSHQMFFDKIFKKQLEGLDIPKSPMIRF